MKTRTSPRSPRSEISPSADETSPKAGLMLHVLRSGALLRGVACALAVLGLVAVQPARAAIQSTWNGTTNVLWATGTNWSAAVPGTGDTAIFNNAGNAKKIIDLGAGVTINTILFDTAAATDYTIGTAGTQTLTLDSGGAITMNATVANAEKFKAKIVLGTAGGTYTITNNNASKLLSFSAGGDTAFVGPAAGSGTSTLDVNAVVGGNFTSVSIVGSIKDGTGNAVKLVKSGAGTLQISSSSGGNTYSGGTYLNAGTLLIVGNATSLQSGSSLFIAGGTSLGSVNQGSGNYTNIVQQWNGDFSFNDSTKGNTSLQQMTFTGGTVDLGATGTDTTRTVTQLDTGHTLTINSVISNGTNGFTTGLTKAGAGTMVLSGANLYTGATAISAGTLTISNASTFTNTSAINLSGTGRLDVNVADQSLAKLASPTGTGVVAGSFLRYSQAQTTGGTGPGTILGTVELNVTNVNPNYTIDFGTGSNLTNLGAYTYNSPITLSGDASITSSSAVFSGGTSMTIGASTGGTKNLTLTGTNNGANTIAGIISNGSGTIGVAKTGGGTWTLSGNNTYTGLTTVSAGTLTLSGANTGTGGVTISGGTLNINNASALGATAGTFTISGGTINNTSGGAITNSNNPITLGGTLTFTGTNDLDLGTGAVTLTGNRTVTVNANTLTVGGAIGQDVAGRQLTKSGAGTLVLSGANTYTGLTTVSAGKLLYGASDAIGTGDVTVTGSTAILDLGANHTDSVGTVILSGGGKIIGTGTSALTSTGTFEMKSGSVSAILAGGAALNKTDVGTVTLSGANTYTGGTNVSGGGGSTLIYSKTAAKPGTGTTTVAAGDNTLGLGVGGTGYFSATDVDNLFAGSMTNVTNDATSIVGINTTAGDFTYASSVPATTRGLTKLGVNTLTLSGNNAYTGATTVRAGTLVLSGNNSSASGATTVNSGTTLRGVGANSLPTGTLTLAGGTLDLLADGSTNFGNNLIVSGSSTINVDRATGAGALNGTHTLGTMSIGGQTLTATGSNGYSLALGATTLTGAATFNPTFANMSVASVTVSSGNQNLTLGGQETNNNTVGAITTGSGTLTKAQQSIWTMTGTSTYSGTTTINAGKLIVNGTKSGAGAVTVNYTGSLGGTGSVAGAVTAANGGSNSNFYIPGGAINLVDGAVGTLTLGSTLTFSSNNANTPNYIQLDLGNGAGGADKIAVTGTFNTSATANTVRVFLNQLSGGAVDAGTYTLIQGGTAGANKNYALGTTRAGGNLYSALGVTGANLQVTVAAGTTGPADSNSFWKGSTSVWNTAQWYSDSGGTVPATIPGYQSNIRFAASSPGNLSNTLGQDFEINNLQVDSGIAATTISGGNMLTIDATNANGNTAGNGITVNNTAGTTIGTDSATATRIGLGSSQTWTVGTGANLTVYSEITDFGNGYTLTKDGPGTLTFKRAMTYTGGTVVNNGTLNLLLAGIGDCGVGLRGALTINTGGTVITPATLGYAANGGTPGAQLDTININGGILDRNATGNSTTGGITFNMTGGTMTHTGGGYWQMWTGNGLGANNFNILPSNNSSLISGRIQFSNYDTQFNVADGNAAVDLEISGHTGGSNGLIKNGAGLMALTANNSTTDASVGIGYSGTTTINAGTLQLGTGGATGNLNPASAILNNGTLAFNRNNTLTQGTDFNSVISGAGAVTQAGAGTTILSGANTYTGATTVSAGTLEVTTAFLNDLSNVYIASGALLNLNTSGATDTIGALYFDTTPQALGTWGSTASAATYKDDTYFSGTGILNVTTPEPATMALMALGGLGLILSRKRR